MSKEAVIVCAAAKIIFHVGNVFKKHTRQISLAKVS